MLRFFNVQKHVLMVFTVVILLVSVVRAFEATSKSPPPSSLSVFPLSTRQALVQKAQQLNAPHQPYSTMGWSNRAATVLTPVSTQGIYTADRPFYWNKIDVGCRCTVIELPSASATTSKPDLWVHSPVGLDGPLMKVLEQLGTVKYVVSPNYEHVKYAPSWHQTYPAAQMWGNPGLAERMPEIKFTGEIPFQYRPVTWKKGSSSSNKPMADGWDLELLQPLHIDCEVNPFTGRPFFNEVIYYHAPSKTLLTTDLFWNYPAADGVPNSQYGRDDSWELAPALNLEGRRPVPFTSLLWKFGMDQVYNPFFKKLMVKDRQTYQDIVDHILNVWDVETVVPAHGDILRGKDFISQVLKQHFAV